MDSWPERVFQGTLAALIYVALLAFAAGVAVWAVRFLLRMVAGA